MVGEMKNDTAQLMKIDLSGNIIWRRDFFSIGHSKSYLYGIEKVYNEPNFYISGEVFGGKPKRSILAKIDTLGDSIWVRRLSEIGYFSLSRDLIQLTDKSIVIVGFRQTPNGYETIAKRFDSTGSAMWENSFPYGQISEGWRASEMMDGSILISGGSVGSNLLYRIGFDGRLIEDTIIQGFNNNVRNTIKLLPNNHSLMSSNQLVPPWFETQLITLDSNIQVENLLFGNDGIPENILVMNNESFWIDHNRPDSLFWVNYDLQLSEISRFNYPFDGSTRDVNDIEFINNQDVIIAGTKKITNNDIWFSRINGFGQEWIPNRCEYSPPIAEFTYDLNYPILSLKDSSYSGLKYLDTIYTWQWNTSLGSTGSEDSLWLFIDTTITKTLDVELIISNWYGCVDTVQKTLNFTPNGIKEIKNEELKIYPNPVRDILNIELMNANNQDYIFSIYDLKGVLIEEVRLNDANIQYDLSHLKSGMYFYKLNAASGPIRGKIVVGDN